MDTFWKHTMLFSDDRSMSKISSYNVTSDCCGKILSMNQQKKFIRVAHLPLSLKFLTFGNVVHYIRYLHLIMLVTSYVKLVFIVQKYCQVGPQMALNL